MAQIIKTNGFVQSVEPKNEKDFTLKELQLFVGGYIEIVQLDNGYIMVVNEEGKLHGLEHNKVASELFRRHALWGNRHDIIVGDALVCKADEVK